MKYIGKITLLTACLGLIILLSGCQKNQTPFQGKQNSDPGTVITFQNGEYSPNKITIKQNQKVTFVNQSDTDIWPASNIHPTHQIYPEFDPKGPVKPGKSWSFTFGRIGQWRFHDHLQPEITGVITVE